MVILFHCIKYRKFFKKKKIIFLFSSRFGHFIQNTEITLRELSRKEINETVFALDRKIDNLELLRIWEKYDLDFCSYEFGKFLSYFKKKNYFFNHWNTVPQKKTFIFKKVLKNIINKKKFFDFEYNSITFRDSNYNLINYNNSGGSFRDTKKKDIKKIITYFNKKKIKIIKVNKSEKKIFGINDYGYNKNYKLDDALCIINGSKIHIGSSTGLDMAAGIFDKPMINPNTLLGNNLISRLYTFPTFILPINLKFKKTKKIVPLSKQIEYLKIAEKKKIINHLDYDLQKLFAVYYETNTYDEIISTYKEYVIFLKNNLKVNKVLKKYQDKFWSIYPKIYKMRVNNQNITTTSNNFYGNVFIPINYFKKYKDFLK